MPPTISDTILPPAVGSIFTTTSLDTRSTTPATVVIRGCWDDGDSERPAYSRAGDPNRANVDAQRSCDLPGVARALRSLLRGGGDRLDDRTARASPPDPTEHRRGCRDTRHRVNHRSLALGYSACAAPSRHGCARVRPSRGSASRGGGRPASWQDAPSRCHRDRCRSRVAWLHSDRRAI